jgi:hypothetical protein
MNPYNETDSSNGQTHTKYKNFLNLLFRASRLCPQQRDMFAAGSVYFNLYVLYAQYFHFVSSDSLKILRLYFIKLRLYQGRFSYKTCVRVYHMKKKISISHCSKSIFLYIDIKNKIQRNLLCM